MQKIFKYPFQITGYFSLDLPAGAQIIYVEMQEGQPCLWAIVNPDAPLKKRHFQIYGTGHAMRTEDQKHIGTFFDDGTFVWHLFELISLVTA